MKKIVKVMLLIGIIFIMTSMTYAKAKIDLPDTVRIKTNDGTILEMDLDEYLYGVVSSEMGTSYKSEGKYKQIDIEALKAQAVASRTYAVYNIIHSKYDGYDITATTSDQVYKAGNVKDIVKRAVDETSGQVMTYNGELICVYFFSTSGGHTESSENVWSAALPYAVGVEDKYEPYIDGNSEWEVRIPADKYGNIEILSRSENGRVTKLQLGKEIYSKNNIRTKLGATLIKSTWFDVEYDSKTDEYVFNGKGYGHGVGMSQYGAIGMAEAGFDYEEILKWYYTGAKIMSNESKKSTNDIQEIDENIIEDTSNNSIQLIEIVEDDEVKREDKDYKSSKPLVVTPQEKGALLKKIIEVIKSWR